MKAYLQLLLATNNNETQLISIKMDKSKLSIIIFFFFLNLIIVY